MKRKSNVTTLPTSSSTKKNEQSIVSSLSPREIVSELRTKILCKFFIAKRDCF